MSPELQIGMFAVNLLVPILVGWWMYSVKRRDAARDGEIAGLRKDLVDLVGKIGSWQLDDARRCRATHEALDARFERQARDNYDAQIGTAAAIQRSMREALDAFARRDEVAGLKEQVRQDIARVHDRIDAVVSAGKEPT
jgi:hypothetical protein